MTTFSITPVSGFPLPTSDEFPDFIQFQADGADLGDNAADTVNFTDGLTATRGTGENANVVTVSSAAPPESSLPVEEDGIGVVAAASTLNFTGTGVAITESPAGTAVITIPGSTVLTVKDEGISVVVSPSSMNFVGAEVAVTESPAGTALVTLVSYFELAVACSDESTALTVGSAKVTFRMPRAVTLTAVRANLVTAQSSGSVFTVDVNEGGVSILSTKLTIDNGERTSVTAATQPVISDTSLADDAEMTVDIDQVGDGTATGLKIALIGTRA